MPSYLEFVINSRETQEQVRLDSSGALLTHFNADDSADLAIPFRTRREQERIVNLLESEGASHFRLVGAVQRQLDLLIEHRQALITAAVTGDLLIPGATAA